MRFKRELLLEKTKPFDVLDEVYDMLSKELAKSIDKEIMNSLSFLYYDGK